MNLFSSSRYRRLTEGEKKLAHRVYQDSLDYDRILIHKGKLIPLFQNKKIAMTPFGTMHFPSDLYVDDYSSASITKQHLFVHEMAHVWQYQLGLSIWLDGVILSIKGGYRERVCYDYTNHVAHCGHFSELNMEQQADVIADWFVFRHTQNQTDIQKLIRDFIANPRDPNLLPRHAEFRFLNHQAA